MEGRAEGKVGHIGSLAEMLGKGQGNEELL